jgi:cobalt-zinc-cadmium efflux system outer membrane protein
VDLPLDLPWQRGPRVSSADASATAARARFVYERAATRFEAEALYARAQEAEAVSGLSDRTARDADSLLVLARIRRDAGDASELEVELAAVVAGQVANLAADNALERIDALLELQRVMGLRADSVIIVLADSLAPPPDAAPLMASAATLPVLAATASLEAAEQGLKLEHGTVFGVPSLTLGFDRGDPGQPGTLPVVGFGLTMPLFDRRKGPIALAASERDRATVALAQTRRDSDADVARARRERATALARVRRDVALLASADRVAQLALVAYQEGASALPSVLESVRTARESQAKYIADVAAALIADASLRWLTATLETP